MNTRLASLFLVLVLASSVFAGVPLHLGEGACSMGAMMDMDCCKVALMQESNPKVAEAKLCCALNCTQGGTTSPPNIVRITPAPSVAAPSHPALTQPLPQPSLLLHRMDHLHGPPKLGPTYLRNLALLI